VCKLVLEVGFFLEKKLNELNLMIGTGSLHQNSRESRFQYSQGIAFKQGEFKRVRVGPANSDPIQRRSGKKTSDFYSQRAGEEFQKDKT
jgi:hypothetical protein